MLRDLDPEVQNDLDMSDLTPIGMLVMRDPGGEDDDQAGRRIDAEGLTLDHTFDHSAAKRRFAREVVCLRSIRSPEPTGKRNGIDRHT